jgi:hypothetical protein
LKATHEIVMAEGFELTQRGNGWRGLCPLHDRDGRNPSFACGEKWFKCYSCGASGDGIAFVMKLKNFTFPQALAHLGEDRQRPTQQEQAERAKERRDRAAARWKESELARTLGIAIRRCHEALRGITPNTLDDHTLILQSLPALEYQHQTLIDGTPGDKAAVVAEWRSVRLFKRTLLFKKNFDFRGLLRATLQKPEPPPVVHQESQHETKRIRIHVDRVQESVS